MARGKEGDALLLCPLSPSLLLLLPPLIKEIEMAAIFIAREERNSGSAATAPQGLRAIKLEVPFLARENRRISWRIPRGVPVALSEGVKMGC